MVQRDSVHFEVQEKSPANPLPRLSTALGLPAALPWQARWVAAGDGQCHCRQTEAHLMVRYILRPPAILCPCSRFSSGETQRWARSKRSPSPPAPGPTLPRALPPGRGLTVVKHGARREGELRVVLCFTGVQSSGFPQR